MLLKLPAKFYRMNKMYNRDPLEYYQVLEVSPDADARTLKLSYRDRAKEWHPDYNKAEDAMEHFQKISVAYDVLQDEEKRLTYDLLACAYDKDDFPQMDALSIFKDRMEEENPDVRAFDLRYVVGRVIKFSDREERLICTQKQAFHEILKCSLVNWLAGWWGIKAFAANCRAIAANYRKTGTNRQDNLTLLIHNAVAYHQEEKDQKALRSILQAAEYALPAQLPFIKHFAEMLGAKTQPPTKWHWQRLRLAHFLVPFVFVMLLLTPVAGSYLGGLGKYMKKENEITYFQKVTFNDGGETVDDIVVSKIFDIPVNIYDENMLYHLPAGGTVMYGPGEKFDVMTTLENGHTVRLTGFTPDKSWYRVMLDNGDMGFVKKSALAKGRGNAVPPLSKIVAGE